MSKSLENLKNAFASKPQANRRYIAFAGKAEEESLPQVARLFRAAAESESIHALNHIRIMGEVKTTIDNLNAALSGETYEFRTMYPEYLNVAKKEGNQQVAWSFDVADKVEQIHAGLFSKAIETLKTGKKLDSVDYYICSICGNTVEGQAPEKCPICGPQNKVLQGNLRITVGQRPILKLCHSNSRGNNRQPQVALRNSHSGGRGFKSRPAYKTPF